MSGVGTVHVRDLHVRYAGGHRAVRGVDLDVPARTCLAIVGESGSGKTSLLRAMLGLLPDSAIVSGVVEMAGHPTVAPSDRQLARVRGRAVGFVPQNPFHAVDPLRRVGAHVQDAARAHGRKLSREELTQRLRAVHIAEAFADGRAYPHQWSGGMLQRACIAAALVHDPPVLLADEPTSALDRGTAEAVLDVMLAPTRTTVLVTHDIALAATVADRIAVMGHGRVIEEGPAAEVCTDPRHPYTTALIAAAAGGVAAELDLLNGLVPAADDEGCPFAAGCSRRRDNCRTVPEFDQGVRCHDARPRSVV